MSQNAYSLFQRGTALLAGGNPHGAVIPLEQARTLEPGKTSVREALARAYFRSGRFRSAEEEFSAIVEIDPSNDYAHFGLALCLERRGRRAEARGHAKLAVAMRPDVEHYRAAYERLAVAS
jgi:Flp pilus assembly protein TadD